MRTLAATFAIAAVLSFSAPCVADSNFTVTRVMAPGGAEPNESSFTPSISADDERLVFGTAATNFTPSSMAGYNLVVNDRSSASFASLCAPTDPKTTTCDQAAVSGDGQWVVFRSNVPNIVSGLSDSRYHVFLRAFGSGSPVLVDGASGVPGNSDASWPVISYDGQIVVFVSTATNLTGSDLNGTQDVFAYSRLLGTVERISVQGGTGSEANGGSDEPALSRDGSIVAFSSTASNLVTGDTNGTQDIFVRDRNSGATELISVATSGALANGASYTPSVSGDGRYVLFRSLATNLSDNPGGVGAAGFHVFLRDRTSHTTRQVDVAFDGTLPDGTASSFTVAMSDDGRFGLFVSEATNLVAGHGAGSSLDLYLASLDTHLIKRVNVRANGIGFTRSVLAAFRREASISSQGQAVTVVFGSWNGDATSSAEPEKAYIYIAHDDCPSDPPGVCGCGKTDQDLNHNGILDCQEPGGRIDTFVPPAPKLTIKKKVMTVTMPAYSNSGLKYVVTMKNGRTTVTKTFTKSVAKITNVSKGTWTVTYKLKLLKLSSKASKAKKGVVK